MNVMPPLCLRVLLAVSTALGADESPRFVRKAALPGAPRTVIVAKGDFEFIAGTVRPRGGTVEDVRFSDLNRDGLPDIIVVIRSAGTGSYPSADAFQLLALGEGC